MNKKRRAFNSMARLQIHFKYLDFMYCRFSFFTQRHTVGTGSRCMGNALYVFP